MINMPYNLSYDVFFDNFDKFKEFAIIHDIKMDILYFNKTSFVNDFNVLIKEMDLFVDYVLYYDDLFVSKMICEKDIPNGNVVYVPNISPHRNEPFLRSFGMYIQSPEPYMSNYEIYMYKILKLYPNSLNSKMLKLIYDFLRGECILPNYINEKLRVSLLSLKEKIFVKNGDIFYSDYNLFLANSTQSLGKIKNYSFKKNIRSFYIYHLKTMKLEFLKIYPRIKDNKLLMIEF